MFERNLVSLPLRFGQRRQGVQLNARCVTEWVSFAQTVQNPEPSLEPAGMVADANRIVAFRTSALHHNRSWCSRPVRNKDRIVHDPGGATGGRSFVVRFPTVTSGPTKPGMRACVCAREFGRATMSSRCFVVYAPGKR